MKGGKVFEFLHVAGDWLDAITDITQMMGLGVKTPPTKEGQKGSFKWDEQVLRKIPWKFLGMLKDEVIWHNIERKLTEPERVIMDGWLRYLTKQRKNNDLTFFFAKSREDLDIDETVDILRTIYLEVAMETKNPKDAYKIMTRKAIDRNILKKAKFSKMAKKKAKEFGEWISPFSKKTKDIIISAGLSAKDVWDESNKRIDSYADKLEQKLEEKKNQRKKRKGWFK